MYGRLKISCILLVLLLLVCLTASSASAMASNYINVRIEVWNVIIWQSLPMRLLRTSITHLDQKDCNGLMTQPACTAACREVLNPTYTITPSMGQAFRVVLQNKTNCELGVTLTLDGASSQGRVPVSGTSSDRKWILQPRGSATIRGWKTTSDEALEFFFTTLEDAFQTLESPDKYGYIKAYVYVGVKGKEAPCEPNKERPVIAMGIKPSASPNPGSVGGGKVVSFPTTCYSFDAFTSHPVEIITIAYSMTIESLLGISCSTNSGWGITVNSVVSDSRASRAGLRSGDVISQAQGIDVLSCADLLEIVSEVTPGNYLTLRVHRSSGVVSVQIAM